MATNGDDSKLLRDISNSIKDLVAPDPPPDQPNKHCFVMKSGSTINPEDFDPKSIVGPKNLAILFNDIPSISAAWETSGKYVTNLWNILLTTGKAPLNPPPSPELEKQYHEAQDKLYSDFDTLTKTPYYESLDTARAHVSEKQFELLGLKTKIKQILGPNASQEEYNATYEEMSPSYIEAVHSAQEEYVLREADVARYTTVLAEYNTGSLETVLKNFKTKMESAKQGSGADLYYKVGATPSSWWTYFQEGYEPDGSWTQVTINQQYSSTTSNDTYTEMGAGVRFLFFSAGGEGQKTIKTTSEESSGVSISFKIKTVDIYRSWMDTALLDYDSITMSSAKAGQWSDGVLKPSNDGSFSLLPTTMVLATDIKVTATEFSSHTKEVFEEYSARTKGFWDLFVFHGSAEHKSHSSLAVWNKDTQTMTVTGVQIIGYACALNPFFPKKSA